MILEYTLAGSGWADASVSDGEFAVFMQVSYLHDSLANLAKAALDMGAGAQEATVVFMDEPGEHQLVLHRREQDALTVELRWYDDWASWGLVPVDRYATVLTTRTSRAELRAEVLKVLDRLNETFGPAEYRQLWIEHDFPIDLHQELRGP